MKPPVTTPLNHDTSIEPQETRKEKKMRRNRDYLRNHETEAARRRRQKQDSEPRHRKRMAKEAAAAAARRSRQSWLLSNAFTPPQFQSHLHPQTLMPLLNPPPINPRYALAPCFTSSGMYWPPPTLNTLVVQYQLQIPPQIVFPPNAKSIIFYFFYWSNLT